MLALFGTPVDQFFIAKLDSEPQPGFEEAITEELYRVALESRMCGGEPRDYEHYDYRPDLDGTMSSIKNDFSHGYHAGYHNIVSALLANRENESFRLGFTAGRDAKLGEHPFTGNIIFESPGMTNFARRGKAGTQ